MCYICDYCDKSVGPRIPLRLITVPGEDRVVTYNVRKVDPETEEESMVIVRGSEITQEFKICPECSGVKHVAPKGVVPSQGEAQAPPARIRLGALALDTMMARTLMTSKRAQADFSAAYVVLKGFEQRGGGLA